MNMRLKLLASLLAVLCAAPALAESGLRDQAKRLFEPIPHEPPALLGDDTAPNPSEALLAAVGTCVAVGLQANAVARGWHIHGITVDVEGDINITSVWGTGDLSPKPVGLTAVRLKVHFDVHGASQAEIDELIAHAATWSPVLNTVRNPVPVEIERV